MSTRHLLRHTTRRRYSTLSPTTASTTLPSPPPPTHMIYDRAAESVKSRLSRLLNPDPRFLRHASPHPTPADHSQILSFPATKLTLLPNGLRVATESSLSSRSASLSVLVDSGSRFETEEKNGVAYFLERVLLGSTPEEAANIGLEFDSFTDREISGFSGRVLGKDLAKGVEVFGKVLQGLDLSDKSIERVRQAIVDENQEIDADGVVMDQLHATAFQYTPLGKTIRGPAEITQSITKADIQDYILSHCSTHRMVISATGGVKHEEFVDQVKKVFTKLSANPATTSQLVASEPAYFTGSEVRMIDDYVPLARFALAFEGASCKDPDAVALMVIQNMLGSWTKYDTDGKHKGSHLVQMAAINQLAESIKTFNINYKDTGLFGIYAVATPDCLDDLGYGIMYEFSKLSYRVSDDDVIRARNQLKSSLLLQSNEISTNSVDLGRQLLMYGRKIPLAELFARIDAVDASTVKRVANRFFFDKDIAIAARGPIKGLPDYNWFRRRTYWLRY